MDYTLLYKRMADVVGLECAYIGGHSKSSVLGGWGGHAWNAVKIDGKWELLDVTWGSGHGDGDGKFRQVFRPGYFCTPPRLFALDHFPDDARWQLLDAPIGKKEFKNQPAFSYGDPENGILDTEPFGLPLATGADGKVELRLKFQRMPSVILLKMGERMIESEQTEKDGWLTLRFVPADGRQLQVWAGERMQKGVRTTLIGVFPIK